MYLSDKYLCITDAYAAQHTHNINTGVAFHINLSIRPGIYPTIGYSVAKHIKYSYFAALLLS